MTVSIDATSRKYKGRKAETYEAIRTKQQRWDIENQVVKRLLVQLKPQSVLDVPVGTGRFIHVYDALRVHRVIGVDVSDHMIMQAAEKARRCRNRSGIMLICKDVRTMKMKTVEVSVCIRFLDLIDEAAMRTVLKTLMRVSTRAIICTIRLGPTYIPKSNTATHDRQKFRRLVVKRGWKIAQRIPVFSQGWFILLLTPEQ